MKDCERCKRGKTYKKAHHWRCGHGRIKGRLEFAIACEKEDKRLKELFAQPLASHEKCNSRPTANDFKVFFCIRKTIVSQSLPAICPTITVATSKTTITAATSTTNDELNSPSKYDGDDLFGGLHHSVKMSDQTPTPQKNKNAPPPLLAFASHLTEQCVPKRTNSRNGDTGNTEAQQAKLKLLRSILPIHMLAVTVPPYRIDGDALDPLYHSIEGQELYIVDWQLQFPGIQLACLDKECNGTLQSDRTNLSKNRRLFPIFKINGPPS